MKDVPRQVQGMRSGKRTGLFVEFTQQWSSLTRSCKWYYFTLIDVSGEFSPYTGRWEVILGLLGFNFRITWVYDGSFNERMLAIVGEIERDHAKGAGTSRDHGAQQPGDEP